VLKATAARRLGVHWKRLGARERLMLTLLFYEGLTPIEAARALGCPVREVLRTVQARLDEWGAAVQVLPMTPARRRAKAAPRRSAA